VASGGAPGRGDGDFDQDIAHAGLAAQRLFDVALDLERVFGSLLVSASETFTVPSKKPAERTSPKDTMSRLKPGYFTCWRHSLIWSEVTWWCN
jgi:hypothetical protein